MTKFHMISKSVNMIISLYYFIVNSSAITNTVNFRIISLIFIKNILTHKLIISLIDNQRYKSNFNYFALFLITLILAVSSQSAYAVVSVEWTYGGVVISPAPGPIPSAVTSDGNLFDASKINVEVDASDEGSFASNGIIDTIDVIVTSVDDPSGVTYTLTETGINTGIFTGTSFVFLTGNHKFQISNTVNLTYTIDPISGCDTDNTIQILDSRFGGTADGFIVASDTDILGIGLALTETGPNTCTFSGQLKFTTGLSDESASTLQVSSGDILAFVDEFSGLFYNAQIIPTVSGKGSIIGLFDVPNDPNSAEVTVTYNGLSRGLDINDDGTGSGAGGAIVRPGLVLNFISFLLSGDSDPSTPPTLGLDENHRRIVDGGFSFNGNSVDVEEFYTPYPLITTTIGENNTIKLKIFEDRGLDNIAHIGLSYGIGHGETFNEGRATIEYDIAFDGKESITIFDPKHVFGNVNVTTNIVDCSVYNKAKCLEVSFNHIFRDTLDYNMVATNIWDLDRNGWQNYFNHGIHIVGESMNPPETYSGIYKGHIYHLTETSKNVAIDNDGYYWTFDKVWTRNYVSPVITHADILNPSKINAIKQLGFSYSDAESIFGFSRTDPRFEENMNQQQIKSEIIMNQICFKCQDKSFDKIDKIFSYDIPSYSRFDKNKSLMDNESLRAQEYLKQYFEKIYVGKKYE